MSKKGNQNIVDAIVDLQTRGYSSDFIVMDNQLFCAQQKIFLHHDEFDINEVYSFQPSQSREETVLYGITSEQHAIKGILLTQPSANKSGVPPVLFKKMGKFWL
ncbi:MAG TPA: hypothetical protein VGN00_06305 [Puia sp.]|jgi:hypothetical protein